MRDGLCQQRKLERTQMLLGYRAVMPPSQPCSHKGERMAIKQKSQGQVWRMAHLQSAFTGWQVEERVTEELSSSEGSDHLAQAEGGGIVFVAPSAGQLYWSWL